MTLNYNNNKKETTFARRKELFAFNISVTFVSEFGCALRNIIINISFHVMMPLR